jgi:hypothetical protein
MPLPDNTQHSQQINIHDPGGIRNHSLTRRAAKDLLLRPRGHRDRHLIEIYLLKRLFCSLLCYLYCIMLPVLYYVTCTVLCYLYCIMLPVLYYVTCTVLCYLYCRIIINKPNLYLYCDSI